MAITTITDFVSSISVSVCDSESVNARIGGSSAGHIAERVAKQPAVHRANDRYPSRDLDRTSSEQTVQNSNYPSSCGSHRRLDGQQLLGHALCDVAG